MKKKGAPFQTFFRLPAFLLVCASFFTIAVTVAAKESEEVRAWLYVNQHSAGCFLVKGLLLFLWIFPTCRLLILLHKKEWQTMLSVLLLILALFFLTAVFISFIYYY